MLSDFAYARLRQGSLRRFAPLTLPALRGSGNDALRQLGVTQRCLIVFVTEQKCRRS